MAKREKQAAEPGVGRLLLHRFCGEEEFILSTAEMLAFRRSGGVRLWFDAETKGECIRVLEDTARHHAWPKLSVRVDLPGLVPNELVGQQFNPRNYDPNGDPPGTIFYFESDELRECAVVVLARDGPVFEVRLSGIATDVNFYDGSKPDTRVEAVGRFTFGKVSEWEST
jgi:hypothetical protein